MRPTALLAGIVLLLGLWAGVAGPAWAQEDEAEKQLRYFRQEIRPIIKTHCVSCHNEADKKAGLNLDKYDFVVQIIRDGPVWVKVLEQVQTGQMPPDTEPPLPPAERDTLLAGIESFLDEALRDPDPGQVVLRRLSNREYRYTALDLLGVDFDAPAFFPADGSGGEGFDNQARVLYLTPLHLERYYAAAEQIAATAAADPGTWRRIVPEPYAPGLGETLAGWWHGLVGEAVCPSDAAVQAARDVLVPLATRAYRRFPTETEKTQLAGLFGQVYCGLDLDAPERFDRSIQEVLTALLISPHFLYRRELDVPLDRPYPITGFELATRLSYFLWASMPDDELLAVAYRGDLHEPAVLEAQVRRLLADPKSKRFAEAFASQWLEIDGLLDGHQVDPSVHSGFDEDLRRALYGEAVVFFHHVLTERQTFLDLLASDYTFLNERLADHYGLGGVDGVELRKVSLADQRRGGVLGLGGVLTATSMPTRTSPVLRGKWVLEQLLGTPPPPPPPDVPELEAAKGEVHDELDLRALLSRHREPSACFGCHQRMDPLGLGLENFDAMGRWRTSYRADAPDAVPIDASGVLTTGEAFTGPAELKRVLMEEKTDLFARNLARKMLSYALGRGVRFEDKYTVDHLTDVLLAHDFHTVTFITAVVNSFPFRYKKSDRGDDA